MVNSKTLACSYGNGLNGKPHSNLSGPKGLNQRKPKFHDVRSVARLSMPSKHGLIAA